MRNWRKMTWVLIIWTALILIWMIAGAGSADDCDADLQDACDVGTGIGVLIVALIGFFGFAFLFMIWVMTRPKGRDCPRCGERVKKGVMVCPSCGFDYRSIGTQAATPPTMPPPPPS